MKGSRAGLVGLLLLGLVAFVLFMNRPSGRDLSVADEGAAAAGVPAAAVSAEGAAPGASGDAPGAGAKAVGKPRVTSAGDAERAGAANPEDPRAPGAGGAGHGGGDSLAALDAPMDAPMDAEGDAADDKPRVVHPIDGGGIAAAIDEVRPAIKQCYAAWRKLSPGLEGTMRVRATIGPDPEDETRGRIVETELVDSQVAHAAVEGCVRNALGEPAFARPDGPAVVTLPFKFDVAPAVAAAEPAAAAATAQEPTAPGAAP